VTTCSILDTTCEAKCSCNAAFGGDGCELSSTTIEVLQQTTNTLLTTLSSVVQIQNASSSSIQNTVAILNSLTTSQSLLTNASANLVQSIASSTLDKALGISFTEIEDVLAPVVDASVTVSKQANHNNILPLPVFAFTHQCDYG